jgi:hypothetical protein
MAEEQQAKCTRNEQAGDMKRLELWLTGLLNVGVTRLSGPASKLSCCARRLASHRRIDILLLQFIDSSPSCGN